MLTKVLILSCAVVLSLGDGQYASKTSKKVAQHPFASTKTGQPTEIRQEQHKIAEHSFASTKTRQPTEIRQEQHSFASTKTRQPTQVRQEQQKIAEQFSNTKYQQPQQFSNTQYQNPQQQYMAPAAPSPYSFNYEADGSSRQESSDASGKVTGSYSVINEDGSKRLVKYIADEQGFRAQIDTDEPGTKSDSPAAVELKSAAKAPTYQPQPASKFSVTSQQKKFQTQISQQPIMQYKQQGFASQQPIMQYKQQDFASQQPAPYSFSYVAESPDGASSRSESADGSGNVAGTYSLSNIDGRQRTVDYTADDAGFKAAVDTNEFGTKSDSPADVKFFSSAAADAPCERCQEGVQIKSSGVAPKAPLSFPAPSPQISSGSGYYSSYASQNKVEEQYQPAGPYEFNYFAQLDDGSSSRSESSDGAGTITGSYKLAVADGRERSVEYIADNGGFRANVNTNEFGTKSDSPADTMFYSTATDQEPAPYKSPASSTYQAMRQSHQVPVSQKSLSLNSQSYMSYQPQQRQSIQFGQAPFASAELRPAPYAFDYKSQSEEGSSSRSESADASGKVIGSYSLTHADGSQRTVEYTADEGGFRAKVHTNEQGTKSDSPADVAFQSSAPQSAPSMPGPYSMGIAPRSKPSSQGAWDNSASKFDGQQRIQIASQAPAAFKTPSAPYVRKQQPFQGVQQQIQEPVQYAPSPYAFNYNAEGSSRQESSDNSGKVTGSYSVTNEDGSTRVVEYIADEGGFRANVKTDEPGTKSDNPANVVLLSSAPEPKPYFPPEPKPYSAPQQQQYQQPSVRSQFPTHSLSQKTSMISQEKIY